MNLPSFDAWYGKQRWPAPRMAGKPSVLLSRLLGLPPPKTQPWSATRYARIMGSGGTTAWYDDRYFTTSNVIITTTMNSPLTNTIWYNAWNTGTATSNSITSFSDGLDDVWSQWITTTTANTGPTVRLGNARTAEEIAAGQEQMRLAMERQAEAVRVADDKARALLESVLPPDELAAFQRDGHLVVHGRSGRRYRLRQGRTANIDVIGRDGRILHRLCAHPDRTMPSLDIMLAQKLWLESDEDEFVRRANEHALIQPAVEPVLEALS